MAINEEQLLAALKQIKEGNFSVRLPENETVITGEIAATFNALVTQMDNVIGEVNRLNREIIAGKLGGQSEIEGLKGVWAETQKISNALEWAITFQIRKISQISVTIAQASLENGYTPPNTRNEIADLQQYVRALAQDKVDLASIDERYANLVGPEAV